MQILWIRTHDGKYDKSQFNANYGSGIILSIFVSWFDRKLQLENKPLSGVLFIINVNWWCDDSSSKVSSYKVSLPQWFAHNSYFLLTMTYLVYHSILVLQRLFLSTVHTWHGFHCICFWKVLRMMRGGDVLWKANEDWAHIDDMLHTKVHISL